MHPVLIDSNMFSAQNRQRYYWTNIKFNKEIKNNNLKFSDIIFEHDFKIKDFSKYVNTIKTSKDGNVISWDTSGKGNYSQQNRCRRINTKMNTLPSSGGDKNNIYLGGTTYRNIHPIEAERMQNLPDNYTECLKSRNKRIEVLGNGWTVDVICHILKGLK